jgi:hypothetical protein
MLQSQNSSLAATASLVSEGNILSRVLSVKTPRKVYCKVAPPQPENEFWPEKSVDADSADLSLTSRRWLHKVASVNKDAASKMLLPGQWAQGLLLRTNTVAEKHRRVVSGTLSGTLLSAYRPGKELM